MHRRDVTCLVTVAHMTIDLGRVGLVADCLEVGRRNVGDELGQYLERQLGVGQTAPGVELGTRHLRVGLGQVQTAVGRQAPEQNVAELGFDGFGGLASMATGRDVLHGVVLRKS